MKLKAQSSKLKKSSKVQAPTPPSSALIRADFGALSLEFLLNFKLWALSF
jgi:hypothetical protein